MKVLVTGGAGFIGSHVVDTYVANGYEVIVVDNLSTGQLSNLNPAVTFYETDIRSPQLQEIFDKERPDFVNHHAAQMDVRRSTVEPLFDADINILGSINVLECAIKFQVKRFIYISSGGAVYGEPESLPCDETHPINPICQYGVSKHTIEHYLYLYNHIYGLDYIVLRYGNVYGPRQNPRGEAGVVAIFTGQMLSDQQVLINGDGEQQRDFVYVTDCAQANLLALTAHQANTIYNIGCGVGTSVNEIFQILKEFSAYQKNAYYGPPKPGETQRIYLNCSKAQSGLRWTPVVSIHGGLKNTVNYIKGNGLINVAVARTNDYEEITS